MSDCNGVEFSSKTRALEYLKRVETDEQIYTVTPNYDDFLSPKYCVKPIPGCKLSGGTFNKGVNRFLDAKNCASGIQKDGPRPTIKIIPQGDPWSVKDDVFIVTK